MQKSLYTDSNASGRLRAVIYNRCSTEEESQREALIQQEREARECVAEQGWILVDIYIEAKSGTTVKGRSEYERLYRDLESGKFDIIVIKSQDRLMRNTKDWYLFLDRMQKNRKRLYIYLDRKFYTPDDALITGIKAILAEEYSRELSKKINNAHRSRQKRGESFVLTNQSYGFRKLPDKTVVLEEREAEMIRLIYQLSAEGYGTHCSSEILFQKGYANHNGKPLSPSVIRKIIRNPIYKGDVVQNRAHYDFERKELVSNPPSEWIIHKNVLPAIVDEELFLRANQGLDMRKCQGNRSGRYPRFSNPSRYTLSGRIVCGLCGSPYYRIGRKNSSGQVMEWKCSNYLQNGRRKKELQKEKIRKVSQSDGAGCDNVHLDERKLYQTLETVCMEKYKKLSGQKEKLLDETIDLLEKALKNDDLLSRRDALQKKREEILKQKDMLLEKLLDGVIQDDDFKRKNLQLQEKADKLDTELRQADEDAARKDQLSARLVQIRKRLENGMIEQAQTEEMMENIQTIRVFPNSMEIVFSPWAVLGLKGEETEMEKELQGKEMQRTVIRIPQCCSTSRRILIEEEKEEIITLMKSNPPITAAQIAVRLGSNTSVVNKRIQELRKEGRIRYSTPNGRGHWIILDERRREQEPAVANVRKKKYNKNSKNK